MSRYARKKDANHSSVVKAFQFAGASWLNIEGSTPGAPDGALGVSGATHLVEIKPDSKLKAHAPRPTQVKFAAEWRGSPVHLVRSPAEAWQLVALLRMTAATRTKAAIALANRVAPATQSQEAPATALPASPVQKRSAAEGEVAQTATHADTVLYALGLIRKVKAQPTLVVGGTGGVNFEVKR